MDEQCEQLVQVGGSRATRRNRPGDPHFRNWWHEHRLDKILTPRSLPLTRTYTIFSEPIKQYITRRLYVYVVKTHPIWGFCGTQEGTVHTRTLTLAHACKPTLPNNVLWAPRSTRKTTVNRATDRLLRSERHARQLVEPKLFLQWKASSHAETTSYVSTRTGTFSFNQSDAIMELGVGIFTPSFCSRYKPSWFLSSC